MLTVRDLLEQLQDQVNSGNGDMAVHVAYNSGDYWRTEVAPSAFCADVLEVEYSSYHQMDTLTDESENAKVVFVIK